MQLMLIKLLLLGILIFFAPFKVSAIPIFARIHKTSCITCHDVFPHLNAFGVAFKNRGYRYPKDLQKKNETENKQKMGAAAYEKLWPEAIWPSDMPMMFPIAAHFSARYASKEPPENVSTFTIPAKTDFLFAATFDDDFSLFAEIEMNTIHDIDFGFRFQYTYSTAFNIALGRVGPAYWLSDHYRLLETPFYWANQQISSGSWNFNDGTNGGIEVWGALENEQLGGGLTYALGTGNGQSDSRNIDINNRKDFYFYGAYKFGGIGVLGSMRAKDKQKSAGYDDHFKVDAFYYNGLSTIQNKNDAFFVYGTSISGRWHVFRVAIGNTIMHSRYYQQNLSRSNIFASIRYQVYPWLWGLARYERQKSSSTVQNKTASRIIPGVVALVRANIRASAEYRAGLEQNPDSGLRINLNFAF